MGGIEYKMAAAVYHSTFFLGVTAPKDENKTVTGCIEFPDDSIRELLPTATLMRTGLPGTDCQGCIEKQYSLTCPSGQVSTLRHRFAKVITYLLENVSE